MIFSLVHCCFPHRPSFCLCQSLDCSAHICLSLDCGHEYLHYVYCSTLTTIISVPKPAAATFTPSRSHLSVVSIYTHIMFCGISSLNERLPRLSPTPFSRQNKSSSSSWNSRSTLSEQLKLTWVLHLLLPQPFFHQRVYEGRREASVYIPPWGHVRANMTTLSVRAMSHGRAHALCRCGDGGCIYGLHWWMTW